MFVTTAYNFDWPSKPRLHRSELQDEIEAVVSRAKSLNCNAIILQVRAFGDRIQRHTDLWKLKYEDERWAMAIRHGQDPDPNNPKHGYDPLAEWMTSCDAAGIELHAWINPFRVNRLVKDSDGRVLPVVEWNDQLWLDPTNARVQAYVLAVVKDLLDNYGPPPINPGPLSEKQRLRQEDDSGIDVIIYDHYIPPPQIPDGKSPSTKPSTPPRVRELMGDYRKLPAEKRVPNREADRVEVVEFIRASSELIHRYPVRFAYSPLSDGTKPEHEKLAKEWFGKGHFDFVVPELYFPRVDPQQPGQGNRFKPKLEEWLKLVPGEANPKPFVVAGLLTLRVQKPEEDQQAPWPEAEIREQMADVRTARAGDEVAAGEAHYGATALRLPDQGGPAAGRNLAERLKRSDGHYAKPRHMADRGEGEKPGQPVVTVSENTDETRTWKAEWKPGTGKKPKQWAVSLRRGGKWETAEIYRKNDTALKAIGADVDQVAVAAISKRNRRGDWTFKQRPW